MTPQFLRSEAARFREMAEGVTDREASRQRLLNMAIDYESRASAADEVRSLEPEPLADPVPVADPIADSGPAVDVVVKTRAGRKSTLRI